MAKTRKKTNQSAKTKIASIGKKIMTEAKKIRKASPRKKWTSCVAEAGRKFKKN